MIDFMAYVSIYAPNEFPDEDGETLDLAGAFSELQQGLKTVAIEVNGPNLLKKIEALLSASHSKYLTGDVSEGARLLIEAEYALRGGAFSDSVD
ncbi:MAG: hypothetical protein JNL58_13765 [Planctomyces sp.]|nr:hypothetical protein [Planctomyces sp.]